MTHIYWAQFLVKRSRECSTTAARGAALLFELIGSAALLARENNRVRFLSRRSVSCLAENIRIRYL